MRTSRYRDTLFSVILLTSSCALNPVTGKNDFVTISESNEIAQGAQYHESIIEQYGVYDNPLLQTYVNDIGQALARKSHRKLLRFHFTVLDSATINAFALPGGYIYITRGIMAYLNSEAEMAAVLAHEIGHVTARHSVRQQSGQFISTLFNVAVTRTTGNESLGQLSRQLTTGLIRGYGRHHELEADRLGAEYLYEVGYNPEALLEVIAVLKGQEIYESARARKENRPANIYHGIFSTHPKNDDRLQAVIHAAKKHSQKQYLNNHTERYLMMINGLRWGRKQTDDIKSPELRIIQAKAGDSFATLALMSTFKDDAENRLRLLNRAFPTGRISPGQTLKMISVNE